MREKYRKSILAAKTRYRIKHKERLTAASREYIKRPEVKARFKEYYLANREKILEYTRKNKALGKSKAKPIDKKKRREACRKHSARKRAGISFYIKDNYYYWKAGILSNGPFVYRKEAIKDAEEAFDL